MKQTVRTCLKNVRYADTWILIVGTIALCFFATSEILSYQGIRFPMRTPLLRLLSLLITCGLLYLGGRLYAQRTCDTCIMKRLMLLFFLLYLYMIFNLTLLDPAMGRGGLLEEAPGDAREYYLSRFVNIVPFRSIYEVYILGFVNGYVNAYYMLLNLLGNICAFMPFSFFLPLFWNMQKRWYVFTPTILLTVGAVEALQFVFMVGSCDIDDLILNAGGAILLYFLFRLPFVSRWRDRFSGFSLQ